MTLTLAKLHKLHEAGFAAGARGVSKKADCPYPANSLEASQWLGGWVEGRRERRARNKPKPMTKGRVR